MKPWGPGGPGGPRAPASPRPPCAPAGPGDPASPYHGKQTCYRKLKLQSIMLMNLMWLALNSLKICVPHFKKVTTGRY